jgi:predicted dienelactone hydrolase
MKVPVLMKFILLIVFISLFNSIITAQINNEFVVGDALPDAPELSARGTYKVGVQTLDFVNKGQIDVLKSKDGVDPTYDRALKVEIWYPAALAEGAKEATQYDEVLGKSDDPKRPIIPFTFAGRAARDAKPLNTEGAFPLLIVSHGYVGSRYLLSYLTENLASKGYVVVAIDHTESTFRDSKGFPSTLLNRAKDDLFILNQMAELNKSKSLFSGLIDADNTAIIGYSMGGYGALNVAGASYSGKLDTLFTTITGGSKAIKTLTTSNVEFKKSLDPRIKAVVAFAPWGMKNGVWDADGLAGLKVPTFFIAGSQDDISGYEDGIKAIFKGTINADRYLLTYANARHNVAPNPPPAAALQAGLHFDEYYRYAEPAWNERRINNINQHFVTAFLGIQLKKKEYAKYLDVKENSNEKLWTGFKPRSSVGLELLHLVSGK